MGHNLPPDPSKNKSNEMQIIFNSSGQQNDCALIYTYYLIGEAWIYSEHSLPSREILINVCGGNECVSVCVFMYKYTLAQLSPSAISHDADLQKQIGQGKEGNRLDIHSHTRMHTH